MKCHLCKKKLRDQELVVEVAKVIENERHGDFVSSPVAVIHLKHIKENNVYT